MKKLLSVLICVMIVFFSISCVYVAMASEDPADVQDGWVDVVSDIAGDHLSGHEEEVKSGLNIAEKFIQRVQQETEKFRQAFHEFIEKIGAFFQNLQKAIGIA